MAVLLNDIVATRGDEPAIVDGRGTRTWVQLNERVERLVHALRDRGLNSGDCVMAMLGNQAEAIEVALACAHGGWLLVPVNWHWVADEVAYVLGDTDAAAVVVDARWVEVVTAALALAGATEAALPSVRLPSVRVLVDGPDGHGADDPPDGFEGYEELVASGVPGEIADAERGGPMFYTSGTTGRPKGVRSVLGTVGGPPEVLTLIAHSLAPAMELRITGASDQQAVQAICGPIYHSAQWVFAHFSLLCGNAVVLQHRFDPDELLSLIDEHQVTNIHLVPTQMMRLLDLGDERWAAFSGNSLRSVIHGAAACPPQTKRDLIDALGPIVTEYYGGTEGGFISVITSDEWLERPGSVGKPLPSFELALLDDLGEPVPQGQPGQVWFRSLLGSDFEYHNAPDKTASAHRNGFGTLGDVGYLDDEGYLFLSGRTIDMIVSGGVNIYPAEIEAVLADHPAISDVAVFAVPHAEMGESVHAAVSLAEGLAWDEALEADVVAWCRERMAGYKCPRSFEVHDELPRSAAGKLLKSPLRKPWWPDTPAQTPTQYWEARYLDRPQVWSGKVNPVLAAEAAGRHPGTALDLGCGEGGDALWLAERGWTVTAVDISQTALDRGAAQAAERGLSTSIVWQRHELGSSFPTGEYDLVSAQFLHSQVALARAEILQQAMGAVAPGGTLLIVSHAEFPPWADVADDAPAMPSPDDELADLSVDRARWEVQRCETAARLATGPGGQEATLVDGIIKLRRLDA
ncbi:MAG: AMP-binding protein [Candidatus Microthrix sp.]|nr:AMP-binding protein [Candidatus Microthrix sp.]MBK7323039.1 AMP-binding protein [Candidatus Microthrix sp.]